MRKVLLVGFAVVVAVTAIVLMQLDSNPIPDDGSDNIPDNVPDPQIPEKPFWWVPPENRENFEAEAIRLELIEAGAVHFNDLFRELVENFGGYWEYENWSSAYHPAPIPKKTSDENDPWKYAYVLSDEFKWWGIRNRVRIPVSMGLRDEVAFNAYNIHLVLENGEWFEAGISWLHPGIWSGVDYPLALYWWHGWGMFPFLESDSDFSQLDENETRQREVDLAVEAYTDRGKNYVSMEATTWVQEPDESWTYEASIRSIAQLPDGDLPNFKFDSTQEQCYWIESGMHLLQDTPVATHFRYEFRDNSGEPGEGFGWFSPPEILYVITENGAQLPMKSVMSSLYMDTWCEFEHDLNIQSSYETVAETNLYLECSFRGGVNDLELRLEYTDYYGTDNLTFWEGTTPIWVEGTWPLTRDVPTDRVAMVVWGEKFIKKYLDQETGEWVWVYENMVLVTLTDAVSTLYGVDVSVSPSDWYGNVGGVVNIPVTVTNTGNVEDTYDLWAYNLDIDNYPPVSPDSVTVPPYESRTATLSAPIPGDASVGEVYEIYVAAQSDEASDSETLYVHVVFIINSSFYPDDDADVTSAGPDEVLNNDIMGAGRVFLKFDLSSIPQDAIIISASLRLRTGGSPHVFLYDKNGECYLITWRRSEVSGSVYGVENDDWGEETITWNNQPALGDWIGSSSMGGDWTDWDVTSWVRGQISGEASFCIISPRGIVFASKELLDIGGFEEDTRPYLEIVTGT